MERLTQPGFDMCADCLKGVLCEHIRDNSFPVCGSKAIYDRLAAYEDIGMEPEKIKVLVDAIRKHEVVFLTKDQCLKSMLIKVDGQWTDFTIAELQDFLRAKREDRLVVLPYKAADKDSRFYLTRLQSLSATEKNAFLMGKWGPQKEEG